MAEAMAVRLADEMDARMDEQLVGATVVVKAAQLAERSVQPSEKK